MLDNACRKPDDWLINIFALSSFASSLIAIFFVLFVLSYFFYDGPITQLADFVCCVYITCDCWDVKHR